MPAPLRCDVGESRWNSTRLARRSLAESTEALALSVHLISGYSRVATPKPTSNLAHIIVCFHRWIRLSLKMNDTLFQGMRCLKLHCLSRLRLTLKENSLCCRHLGVNLPNKPKSLFISNAPFYDARLIAAIYSFFSPPDFMAMHTTFKWSTNFGNKQIHSINQM